MPQRRKFVDDQKNNIVDESILKKHAMMLDRFHNLIMRIFRYICNV